MRRSRKAVTLLDVAARALVVGIALLVSPALVGFVPTGGAGPAQVATVASVVDGDTIVLRGGGRVRLLQIDSPEIGDGECYSHRAARELRRLLPVGTIVSLLPDPRLDRVDRYGRLLRYVFRGGRNINLTLVSRGAATVWFYRRDRGRYAAGLLSRGRTARRAHLGLWGACEAVWNPYAPATTRYKGAPAGSTSRRCDSSYPTVCISPPPPDLDCADVPYTNFEVVGSDPHHFDGDDDGRGCEGSR